MTRAAEQFCLFAPTRPESPVVFSREWSMPSRWTFEMKPVAALLSRVLAGARTIIDPFAGRSTLGTVRNDLAHGGVDAREFCRGLIDRGVVADAALLDPPYSPRQVSACYRGIGRAVTITDTQTAVLYSEMKDLLSRLLRPGGVAVTFGWNSVGFGAGRGFDLCEILLVSHGGAHNDTICTVEHKL